MDKIINNHVKCYLIGAMESTASNDDGVGWRTKLRPELQKRVDENGNHVYVFDPTLHEEKKVGLSTKEFHAKLHGWLQGGYKDKVREGMDLIWRGKTYLKPTEDETEAELVHIPGDIDYVRQSDFLVLNIEEGDRPCGTYCEVMLAYIHRIPIYLLQKMPLTSYNKTLLGMVWGSNGEIFPNQKQLLEFLDEHYNLKVKKQEKN